jgi:hypothetical protein
MVRPLRRGLLLLCVAATSLAAQGAAAPVRTLPNRLSDAEFWRLVTEGSERGGAFPYDNFTSNELGFPRLMRQLMARADTGGAYIGVGPEQNFNYMLAVRPRIAFLVDVRRQSMLQHLMYKAAFELSRDRADFISLLFSKPRPAGLDSTTSLFDIWESYWSVPSDRELVGDNLNRILAHLTLTHRFALSTEDLQTLRYTYEVFFRFGPTVSYSATLDKAAPVIPAGQGTLSFVGGRILPTREDTLKADTDSAAMVARINGGVPREIRPGVLASVTVSVIDPFSGLRVAGTAVTRYYGGVNFASLSMAADDDGVPRGFLANEANFRYVKDLHTRNLFVPLVGDFAGPKAIRSIGQYLRDHGTTLSAFYTSNVEDYLFPGAQRANGVTNRPLLVGVSREFYDNVGSLPLTPTSVFIRGGTSLCPIGSLLASIEAGRVRSLSDVIACPR